MSSSIETINQTLTASTGKSTAKTTADAVMGKQDFLKLLVAQLQNQDPLKPDDPTAFTAQLAQFSSLEQLTNLNDSVNKLVTADTSSSNLTTLSTIGKNVAYSGSALNFTGTSVDLGYKLDAQASDVSIALQLDGATVATLKGTELSAGTHYLTWNGLTAAGTQAPCGNYKIVSRATSADGKSVSASSLLKSEVTGVDLGGTAGATLITKAGTTPFSSVIGIFDAGSTTTTTTTTTLAKETANTASQLAATANNVI